MTDWNTKANDIYLEARSLSESTSRDEFVREACNGDERVMERVSSMLAADKSAGDFSPPPLPLSTKQRWNAWLLRLELG